MIKILKFTLIFCGVIVGILIAFTVIDAVLDGANEIMDEMLSERDGGYSYTSSNTGTSSQEQIRVVNNKGYEIWELNISPSSADYWGEDLLGSGVLKNTEFVYRLPQPTSRVNKYDIRLEDEDGDEYVKWHVNVIGNTRIVFTLDDIVKDDYTAPASQQPSHVTQQPASTPASQPSSASQPAQQPASQPVAVSQGGDVRSAIVSAAQNYLGARYVYGAQTPPSRFDCSGLINQAYRDGANIVIPRSSVDILAKGTRVNRSAMAPGDIIVYSDNGKTATHVALYVNSTDIIHAVSIGNPTGVIRGKQTDGTWPSKEIGYVTFIGVPATVSRSTSKGLAVTDLLVDITSTLTRRTEGLPILAGSALSFVITNNTGGEGDFDLYFYKAGASKTSGETESIRIMDGESEESKAYLCEDAGLYRLDIIRRADNKTLLEYTFNVEN